MNAEREYTYSVVAQNWIVAGNWREGVNPNPDNPRAAYWLPPSKLDVQRPSMSDLILSTDSDNPKFLEPTKDSSLASEGHQPKDLRIPKYIGAKPPQGAQPWNWQTTYADLVK